MIPVDWRKAALCAVGSLALSTTVSGQVILGSIAGTVTDGTGAALPGVTVTVTSPALQVPQVVRISDAAGEYQITELPAGVYQVTYELSGFSKLVREGIRLTTGFNARVDVGLQLASVAETVTVVTGTPLVDVVSVNCLSVKPHGCIILRTRFTLFTNTGFSASSTVAPRPAS